MVYCDKLSVADKGQSCLLWSFTSVQRQTYHRMEPDPAEADFLGAKEGIL